MKYLLDTCVLSEITKSKPAAGVTEWFNSQPEQNLYISVLTLGEIVKGIERLPESKKRTQLESWLNKDLSIRFEDRIYDITPDVAYEWGRLSFLSESKGKTVAPVDGLISATARVYGCQLVTRNISDMPLSANEMLNPWVD